MFTPINLLLVLSGTTTALIAGLFYAWSCSVTPGLARRNFESRWNGLNIVRTVAAILSMVLFLFACLAPHPKAI